ncbi:MAG TPA: hypothetical protein VGP72_08820 [Planctomycetota bacterium]|jgi:hypothetical protein
MSGRHFILLGIIACAGLISVHDGQRQVELCYQIAAMEKDMREVRSQIDLCKIKHLALQSPRAVMTQATTLQLKVGPVEPAPLDGGSLPNVTMNVPVRSLGPAHSTTGTHTVPPAPNRNGH